MLEASRELRFAAVLSSVRPNRHIAAKGSLLGVAGSDVADTLHALHAAVLAEVPHLELECCQLWVEPGKQPAGKTLSEALPPANDHAEDYPG